MEDDKMPERYRTLWEVTKWEFNRFFKWIDLVKGFLFFVGFGLIGGTIGYWLGKESLTPPMIAIAAHQPFDADLFEHDLLRFSHHTDEHPDTLEQWLETGEIDGILTIHSVDEATIRLKGERGWLVPLEQFLNELRRDEIIRESGVDPGLFTLLEDGITLNSVRDIVSTSTRADKIVAGIAIMLIFVAVFMGFAYQFTAITAEKQQRITEQVISAIHPQTWIDGKILGITGIGMAYILFYGAMSILSAVVLINFGVPVGAGLALINPLLLVTFILIVLLGILMWNAFYAAIAATIDDPNTSQKTGWMMMPIFPVLLSFFALVNPDSLPIKVFSLFPLTSTAILPARMVMTQVMWWEPVLALLLLFGTALLFRIAAGRIFATAIMMVGKEPSLREIVYWFRRA